jgi:hypothetical protein
MSVRCSRQLIGRGPARASWSRLPLLVGGEGDPEVADNGVAAQPFLRGVDAATSTTSSARQRTKQPL